MKILNFAFIGCGRIAHKHAELLGNNNISNARLCAVCDIIPSRAEEIGKKYNIPWYTDIAVLLSRENIDVVSVLTPSGMHAGHTTMLAGYRKHIIVEKPMSLTLKDADKMIEQCNINGVKLFVIKQNRFNVPVIKLREALVAGRFGKLVLGTVRVRWCRTQEYYDHDNWRGTWKFDRGVLTNQAIHYIDLLEWMMGDVESVFAKSATALVDIEVEDTAIVLLKFTSGALGIIEATTATRPKDIEASISVLGQGGTVEIGGIATNVVKVWEFTHPLPDDINAVTKYSTDFPDIYGFGHKAFYEHTVDCILHNKEHLTDGFEGRKSLELISAIYESIQSGKEVFLKHQTQRCGVGL